MKTIAIVLSYNNPMMTDRLVKNIHSVIKKHMDVIVLDNGSDEDKISLYTTHKIENNCRMTLGFNRGIEIVSKEYSDYDNIWFFTNDCYFIDNGKCPLESSEFFIDKYPSIGILHPSENHDVNVIYDVHNDPSIDGVKIVVHYDIVCPIFTRRAIEAIGGNFNEKLYQGWGLDYESSFLVRKAGLQVGINHRTIIGHDTSSTYDKGLDRLHPNRKSYYHAATVEMYNVFNRTYGHDWYNKFSTLYNNDNGKILR